MSTNELPPLLEPLSRGARWISLEEIEQQTQATVLRAGDPAYHPQMEEVYTEQAAAAVAAGGEAPFDPDGRWSHKEALTAIRDAWAQVEVARQRVTEATGRYEQALLSCAQVKGGWTFSVLSGVWLLSFAMAAVAVVAISELLKETVCNFIKLQFYSVRYGDGIMAQQQLFEVSLDDATLTAYFLVAAVVFLPTISNLLTSGRLGRLKWAFLLPELLFALGFGLIRWQGSGFSFQALSYTLFEFAVALLHILCLVGLGQVLITEHDQAQAKQTATDSVRVLLGLLETARRQVTAAQQTYQRQVAAVQVREEDVWMRAQATELARRTARLAYDSTTQEIAKRYLQEEEL